MLTDVLDQEQRRIRTASAGGDPGIRAERDDLDAENLLRRMREGLFERGHRDAGFDDGKDEAAELLRKIRKLEHRFGGAIRNEDLPGGMIGVEGGKVRADDHAAAAEMPEDIG